MAKQKKRRVWSAEEKRLICGQARLPGVSVSQVARWYDVNANLVLTWLRDPRFADGGGEVAAFLPVEIVRPPERAPAPSPGEGRIEIELAGGHRLRILAEVRAQAVLIEKLRHQLAGHIRHRFGASSETAEQLQLELETSEIAAAAMTARLRLPDLEAIGEEKDRKRSVSTGL